MLYATLGLASERERVVKGKDEKFLDPPLSSVAAAGCEPQARTFGRGEKMSGSGVPQGEGTALCATIESKIKEALQVPLPPSSPHSSLASKSSFIPTSGESHTTPRLPFAAPYGPVLAYCRVGGELEASDELWL